MFRRNLPIWLRLKINRKRKVEGNIMLNTVHLIGRLTETVDLCYTSSGNAVGKFLLAVNRNYKKQNGEREADFLRCVIWKSKEV